jgi:hypothetical protein
MHFVIHEIVEWCYGLSYIELEQLRRMLCRALKV